MSQPTPDSTTLPIATDPLQTPRATTTLPTEHTPPTGGPEEVLIAVDQPTQAAIRQVVTEQPSVVTSDAAPHEVAPEPASSTESGQASPSVPPRARRTPKKASNSLSEAELEDWAARVERLKQEREAERQAQADKRAKKQAQAAAWKTIRHLVEQAAAAEATQPDPVDDDPLASRVRHAPKHLRDVITQVLTAHGY